MTTDEILDLVQERRAKGLPDLVAEQPTVKPMTLKETEIYFAERGFVKPQSRPPGKRSIYAKDPIVNKMRKTTSTAHCVNNFEEIMSDSDKTKEFLNGLDKTIREKGHILRKTTRR